ncbi:hypothetical protein [Mucilaginibacter sp. SP1R1]|uniref:hypothetical protein n=1 Tax=Mucilaginibacter sp. SP1R1 TaxID=2723091 RepID=UPI0016222CA0|nr:hypothetical protein [Mucilaginibacter sp. SP1R1]MBB6152221.1 hypothetical protein [Mucilaginibacter sp. SP1R1]
MIILSQTTNILFYSVNEGYFDKHNEAACDTSMSYPWQRITKDTFSLNCNLSLSAKDSKDEDIFIEYKSRSVIVVKFEDEEKDALQALDILEGLRVSMLSFIENNSLSYYSKLLAPQYDVPAEIVEDNRIRMKANIAQIKNATAFEDQSDDEKRMHLRIQKMINNTVVKTVINKIEEKG